ncbi:MAG: hypothetical protein NC307_06460 [Roseburia sp.]|nr:hypothetical protein [Roseburia sp.]
MKNLDTLKDVTAEHIQKLRLLDERLNRLAGNEEELQKNEKELADLIETLAKEGSDSVFAAALIPAYILYFYRHQTNFYAMLRIISLIEFVNINEANNPKSILEEKQLSTGTNMSLNG